MYTFEEGLTTNSFTVNINHGGNDTRQLQYVPTWCITGLIFNHRSCCSYTYLNKHKIMLFSNLPKVLFKVKFNQSVPSILATLAFENNTTLKFMLIGLDHYFQFIWNWYSIH